MKQPENSYECPRCRNPVENRGNDCLVRHDGRWLCYPCVIDDLEAKATLAASELSETKKRAEIAEREIVRLVKLLAEPDSVKIEAAKNSDMFATIKHWGAKVIALSLAETIKEMNAENFVTMTFGAPDDGVGIIVTVRRATGKTPEEMWWEVTEQLAQANRTIDLMREGRMSA